MDEMKKDSPKTGPADTGRRVPVEEFSADQLGADHPLVRPLTEEEAEKTTRREEMDRRRAETLEYWKKYSERQVEEANRLLCDHDASEEEIAKLRALKPIPHHGDAPLPKDGEEDTHQCSGECWAWLLQPLRYWPSDLLQVYGPNLLFHPLITEAIRRLSMFASDPLLVHNPDPIAIAAKNEIRDALERVPPGEREVRREELLAEMPLPVRGFAAIRSLSRPLRYGVALRDETEDRQRYREARAELQRMVRALAKRRTSRRKSHRYLRVFSEFQDLREKGVSEKKAVAELSRVSAREGVRGGAGLSEAAIRSDIIRARRKLGKRKLPRHHRGRFRDPQRES